MHVCIGFQTKLLSQSIGVNDMNPFTPLSYVKIQMFDWNIEFISRALAFKQI